MEIITKICSVCKEEKTSDAFYVNNRCEDGIDYLCKACKSSRDKFYREKNNYRERRKPDDRKNSLRYRYGITIEQYDNMLKTQGGVCKVCGVSQKKNLVVDHDHATGKVRGLLCFRCNAALGFFEDPKIAHKLKEYLES